MLSGEGVAAGRGQQGALAARDAALARRAAQRLH